MIRRNWQRLAMLVVVLATLLTALFPRWVEPVLGFDPDGGTGVFEDALLFLVVLAIAVALFRFARPLARYRPRR